MEEILGIILFLLLIGGASALRWWIEKQQREKEAGEREQGAAARRPSVPSPGRQPVFDSRAGEEPAPEAEPIYLETPVPTPTDRQVRRSARRAAPPQLSPAPQAEPLKPPGTIKAAAPVAVSRAGPFLGLLLERENLAKAVVLSEILGPPKALRDS